VTVPPSVPPRGRAVDAPALEVAGAVALAVVPAAMVLANRSSPLVVGVAALLFLAASVMRSSLAATVRDLAPPFRHPLGLAVLAFLGWCLVSLAWSPFPALSLRTAAEFLTTLVAAYALARLAPPRLSAGAPVLAAALLAVAALYVVASLVTDLAPQQALGQRAALFVLNRPVLTLLLVTGPLAALLAVRGRPRLATGVVLVGALAVLRSISGAAAMGLLAGLSMAGLAWWLPRPVALGLAGLGLGLCLALSPLEGDLLHRFMPEAAHERLVQSSSRARVAIAQSFGAAVAAQPWLGAGYGVSARFAEAPVARALEPELRGMLAVGHPHNSFLQIWAELGLVGALLSGAILALTLRALAGLPRASFVAALGLLAAAAAVMAVEHGAWQGWWTAGLGVAATWLRAAWLAQTHSRTSLSP